MSLGDLTQIWRISNVNKFLKTQRLEVRNLGSRWVFFVCALFFLIAEKTLKNINYSKAFKITRNQEKLVKLQKFASVIYLKLTFNM